MKKAICFLLVVLLVFPANVLAADSIWDPPTIAGADSSGEPAAPPEDTAGDSSTEPADTPVETPDAGSTVSDEIPAEKPADTPDGTQPGDPVLTVPDETQPKDPAAVVNPDESQPKDPAAVVNPDEAQPKDPAAVINPDDTKPEDPAASPDGNDPEQPGDPADADPDAKDGETADKSDTPSGETKDDKEDEEDATVSMRVPANGQVIINPYGYSIDTAQGSTSEQIISTTQYLTSASDVPIAVSVDIEGTHSDPNARFVGTEPNPSEKELFLYAEFQYVKEGEEPVWIGHYTGAPCQVLVNQSQENAVTIPCGEDGETGRAAFRLFGSVSRSPDNGWTANDSLVVRMSYKFIPIVEEKAETPEEEDGKTAEGEEKTETTETPDEDGKTAEETKPEQTPEQSAGDQNEAVTPTEPVEPDRTEDNASDPDEIQGDEEWPEEDAGIVSYPEDDGNTWFVFNDRTSSRDEEDDDEREDDGYSWMTPTDEPVNSEEEDNRRDEPEQSTGSPSHSTDSSSRDIAWFTPTDETGEDDGSSRDDDGDGDEPDTTEPEPAESKTEEQTESSSGDSDDGIAWMTPT